MNYRLLVTRVEPNPSAGIRDAYGSMQPDTVERQVLDVTVNEDEWTAIKRAAIEATK